VPGHDRGQHFLLGSYYLLHRWAVRSVILTLCAAPPHPAP
jgi:hypothetical protein